MTVNSDCTPMTEDVEDLTERMFLQRASVNEAVIRGFKKIREIRKKPRGDWTSAEYTFFEEWERNKSMFLGNPKYKDVWGPAPAEIISIIDGSIRAVETDEVMPKWGPRSPNAENEHAELLKKRKATEAKVNKDAMAFDAKFMADCRALAELRLRSKQRPRTPPANVDKKRDPALKPKPSPPGVTHAALVAAATARGQPPKRKAMEALDMNESNAESQRPRVVPPDIPHTDITRIIDFGEGNTPEA